MDDDGTGRAFFGGRAGTGDALLVNDDDDDGDGDGDDGIGEDEDGDDDVTIGDEISVVEPRRERSLADCC